MKQNTNSHGSRDHVKLALSDILPVSTSHDSGTKKVLAGQFAEPVKIKQVAVGRLEPGDDIGSHVHQDMDEYYFILEGKAMMQVQDQTYQLKKGDFILVTAGSAHRIYDIRETLEFYYQSYEML
ncbi:MAG: cupin domain-containing protein [Chitinophagaceae bacterium]|nr:MAG: cupin domain-containing protein [Chitinophagaceae bacterium]